MLTFVLLLPIFANIRHGIGEWTKKEKTNLLTMPYTNEMISCYNVYYYGYLHPENGLMVAFWGESKTMGGNYGKENFKIFQYPAGDLHGSQHDACCSVGYGSRCALPEAQQ